MGSSALSVMVGYEEGELFSLGHGGPSRKDGVERV
jgi:hypothetical protein